MPGWFSIESLPGLSDGVVVVVVSGGVVVVVVVSVGVVVVVVVSVGVVVVVVVTGGVVVVFVGAGVMIVCAGVATEWQPGVRHSSMVGFVGWKIAGKAKSPLL